MKTTIHLLFDDFLDAIVNPKSKLVDIAISLYALSNEGHEDPAIAKHLTLWRYSFEPGFDEHFWSERYTLLNVGPVADVALNEPAFYEYLHSHNMPRDLRKFVRLTYGLNIHVGDLTTHEYVEVLQREIERWELLQHIGSSKQSEQRKRKLM